MNEEQIVRYSRNIILKEVGGKGQERLLRSKVLVVGAGGLGAPAVLYLAAAGVGTIGIADGDAVDLSNLQRQVIHFTDDVGRPKVESAREKVARLNPDVRVVLHHGRVAADNIREVIEPYDFVLDGTDNFPAKFLINDACVLYDKPFSHAGILRFDGQTTTVLPRRSACYRCLFLSPPPAGAVPSCSQAGVIGGMAGVIGTIQALEAIKHVLGLGGLLTNRLLVFDARVMTFREIRVKRNPACPVCGEHPIVTELTDIEQKACDLR